MRRSCSDSLATSCPLFQPLDGQLLLLQSLIQHQHGLVLLLYLLNQARQHVCLASSGRCSWLTTIVCGGGVLTAVFRRPAGSLWPLAWSGLGAGCVPCGALSMFAGCFWLLALSAAAPHLQCKSNKKR